MQYLRMGTRAGKCHLPPVPSANARNLEVLERALLKGPALKRCTARRVFGTCPSGKTWLTWKPDLGLASSAWLYLPNLGPVR